jgi:pimeloyl-ACP methyl ester carboxylesterase
VRGLVLAHTRATADDESTIADRHRLAAEIERDGVDVAAEELLPKLLGVSTTRDRPELVDHVHALVLENKEPGVAGALRAMASRRDATPLLGSIGCPVLVITGSEDTLVTPAAARSMAARIPAAQIEILRAGHLSNLEASADFDRALAHFARIAHGTRRATARARGAGA